MKLKAAAVFLALNAAKTLFSFELHSSLLESKSVNGKKILFNIGAKPNANMAISKDGPWKLKIKNPQGFECVPSCELKNPKIENESAVFTVEIATTQEQGKLEYELVAFICTKDKTQCFRDVLSKKSTWSLAAKRL